MAVKFHIGKGGLILADAVNIDANTACSYNNRNSLPFILDGSLATSITLQVPSNIFPKCSLIEIVLQNGKFKVWLAPHLNLAVVFAFTFYLYSGRMP